MIKIAPSILAADFGNLERDIQRVSSADYLHVDVMDGLFVPNLSVGFPVLKSVRAATDMPLDVHLMIDRPVRYVERFCEYGADIVTIHVEADNEKDIAHALELIRSHKKKAGIALRPMTPAKAVLPFLDKCDLILVMTVEPGFGGQKFMADMMPKLQQMKVWSSQWGLDHELEVDGGINVETAKVAVAHGANVLVAGSAVYQAEDVPARIREMRG